MEIKTKTKNKTKKKQDPSICCLQETNFRSKHTHRLKVRRWKMAFHANGNQKKASVSNLYKIDCKRRL